MGSVHVLGWGQSDNFTCIPSFFSKDRWCQLHPLLVHEICPWSGDIAAEGHVSFTPETCGVSRERFYVGEAQVEINVAWSVLVPDKGDISDKGWVSEISHM
jgi:hypothetical protein